MAEKITVISKKEKLAKVLKVAAYARVSSGKDAMLHSLASQVSYYSNLIQNRKGWIFVGVYSDEAISGTKKDRDDFNKMILDARARKFDLLITKSISRFARNTVTLLETVRELKKCNIDIYFEEQHIHTLSSDGELLITILASYAQEEARSVSENMKWRIKKNFAEGIPWGAKGSFGYKYVKNHFEIVPNEAELVKYIYELYLSGLGYVAIFKRLNAEGYKTRSGGAWTYNSIEQIITNYDYTGNLILQKTFVDDYITKRTKINRGERQKYHIEEAHEAIIPIDVWNKVQAIRESRFEKVKPFRIRGSSSPFKSLVHCGQCGHAYVRKKSRYRTYWICNTFLRFGKSECTAKQISQQELERTTMEALEIEGVNATAVVENISGICVFNDGNIKFVFKNGSEKTLTWRVLSRKDSWTPEMKAKARGRLQNAKNNSNSTNN